MKVNRFRRTVKKSQGGQTPKTCFRGGTKPQNKPTITINTKNFKDFAIFSRIPRGAGRQPFTPLPAGKMWEKS